MYAMLMSLKIVSVVEDVEIVDNAMVIGHVIDLVGVKEVLIVILINVVLMKETIG